LDPPSELLEVISSLGFVVAIVFGPSAVVDKVCEGESDADCGCGGCCDGDGVFTETVVGAVEQNVSRMISE
jgi:hypothetical protein